MQPPIQEIQSNLTSLEGLFHVCLNLLFFLGIQDWLHQRELPCYSLVAIQHNSRAGLPSLGGRGSQVSWPNPRVTAVTASPQSFQHPTTPGQARAVSVHMVRISLSQSHRSRNFYSSRHLNENQHVHLYIPDSPKNLNYCGNKPCVH